MGKKTVVEKALALARQGHDTKCIDELERLLANWDDIPDEEVEPESSGLELDLPPSMHLTPMPKFEVAQDGSSVSIEDGWGIDQEYANEMMTVLSGLDVRRLVHEATIMIERGVNLGKIWRES
jgi:hypothetical protein